MVYKKIAVIIISLLTLPLFAGAQSTTSPETNFLKRMKIWNRASSSIPLPSNRPERVENRQEFRQNIRLKNWGERRVFIRERIEVIRTHIARMEALSTRLLERVGEKEAAGSDMSAAKTKISEAQVFLTDAKTTLDEFVTALPTELNASSTPGAVVSRLKQSLNEVTTLLRSAHQSLIEAWRLINQV